MSQAVKTKSASENAPEGAQPQVWWSNAVFFILVHVAAAVGVYYLPPWAVHKKTLLLWFLTWQMSDFGITIGYHRLYSHKAFRATLGVRVVLAILGSAAFQGSIKRFTDDPVHDPYAATRGLFYSHMGWIFYKPNYTRMALIEKDDLESDPVVQYQHHYYVPLALFFGFFCPVLIGSWWDDKLGAFVWGGLVARLFIWHCTFLVNSLAHWDGLQPYSDEDTSRGNLILALLTGGEGNHNFVSHSFPHDFRSGPSLADWDPSKWIIIALQQLGLVASLRRARKEDLDEAIHHMKKKASTGVDEPEDRRWDGETWNNVQVVDFAKAKTGRCIVLIDGYAVDVTAYLGQHPGGAKLLREYSIRLTSDIDSWRKADWAFKGGLNNHSRAARRQMREMRVAKLVD
uniref:Acyl-CoA desaturase n=1 Tax=Psilocybe cubensis TaxID=181762 RepID=A0A8H7Y9T2_PSICU